MGIRKRLWDWCQKPKKRDSHFLARFAIWLHLPKVRIPQMSLSLNLISFLTSLPLTYAGMDFFYSLITGRYIDLRDQYVIFVLLYIPFFFAISWTVTHFTLSKLKREGRKVLLFSALLLIIAPVGFAVGLNNGVFDSIITENNILDLYNCKATLNIRNIGLTDIQIRKIEIGDLVCDFSSKQYNMLSEPYLKRGEFYTMVIYYANEVYGSGFFDSNLNVTPTTFREGKYPVVIHIDGITTYKSEIEAKFSKIEEIYRVTGRSSLYMAEQSYWLPRIELTFEMAPKSIVCIYSVTIGNLTLTFEHPVRVYGDEDTGQNSIKLYPDYGHYYAWGITHNFENAFPNQPIDSQIFKDGETYPLTVRTMANNNYTATITIRK